VNNNITRLTISDYVYENIKNRIRKNEFSVAQCLREVKISQELDVSPTPVREAFRRLVSEGYLEEIPYKGVFIREYTDEEKVEVMYYAAEIISLFIRMAIEKCNNTDYMGVVEILEKNIIKDQGVYEFLIGNKMFYSSMIKLGNSKILQQCIQPIFAVIRPDAYKKGGKFIDSSDIRILYNELLHHLKIQNVESIRESNMKIVNYLVKVNM